MNKKDTFELKPIGNVKIVIPLGSKPISRNPDEGDIVRAYLECYDFNMFSGKTFRQEMERPSAIRTKNPFINDKPLRLPIYIGELTGITQEKII